MGVGALRIGNRQRYRHTMSRPVWIVEGIKKAFPHVFGAARLTKVPLLGSLLKRWLFDGDDMIYLPRDKVIAINESVASAMPTVLPSQVVDHFIDQAHHHWIMNFCLCRTGAHCKTYPHSLGCLFLGPATMQINRHLGRRVTREEAHAHVRRCREAGLVHLIGRNRLDAVWLGVRPADQLLTICNCCPCCCLWRVLPHVAPSISRGVTRMPGVEVSVTDRCIACGTCTQGVCFVDAIRVTEQRAIIGDTCRGCGQCVLACPNHAIEIAVDVASAVRTAIERLNPLVRLTADT